MLDQQTALALLQVTVPPATPLSVTSQMKMLKILGIVSREASVEAMNMAIELVPAGTQATLQSLASLLTSLAKSNPDCPTSARSQLNELLANLKSQPDSPLTYGAFLGICELWINDYPKGAEHKGAAKSKRSYAST